MKLYTGVFVVGFSVIPNMIALGLASVEDKPLADAKGVLAQLEELKKEVCALRDFKSRIESVIQLGNQQGAESADKGGGRIVFHASGIDFFPTSGRADLFFRLQHDGEVYLKNGDPAAYHFVVVDNKESPTHFKRTHPAPDNIQKIDK